MIALASVMPIKGQALCGAKTRKGVPCVDIAMANGRCKRHGGKSTGPKVPLVGGKSNFAKHGLYSAYYTEDEKASLEDLVLGNVDADLRLCRVRLKRALMMRKKWEDSLADGADGSGELVLVERVEGESIGEGGEVTPVEKKTSKLPDFEKIESVLLGRIESLERTRKELGASDSEPDDAARKIKDALDEIEGTVPDAPAG